MAAGDIESADFSETGYSFTLSLISGKYKPFTPECLIRPVKGEKYFALKPEERQQPPKKKKDGRPPKPEGTVHRGRRPDGQKGRMSPKKKAAFAKQRAKKNGK